MMLPLASAALVGLLSQTPVTPAPPVAPVAPAAPENPLTHLFPNLGTDLKAMASANTVWVLGFGGAGALVLHNNSDERLHTWVLKQPPASGSASAGNVIGDGFVQGGAAIGVWLAGRSAHNVKVETLGADLIRAQALNGLLTQGIKLTVNRARPDGGSHSFPSGHTSAAFATAATIQGNYGIGAAMPFYALGGFVGWSRIRSNHHWLSDAVFGAALGMASGHAATRHYPRNWTVTPVRTQGGVALYVVKTS